MKIALVTNVYPNAPEHTLAVIFEDLGRAYQRAGHDVVCVWQHRPAKPAFPAFNMEKLSIPAFLIGGAAPYNSKDRIKKSLRELRRILRSVDWIHFHTAGPGDRLEAHDRMVISASRGIGLLGVTFHTVSGSSQDALTYYLDGSAWVSVLSSYESRRVGAISRSLSRRIHKVPNGVDGELFESFSKVKTAASRASPPHPYVLCLARQAHYKGLDVLLMAWAAVCRKLGGVDLVLVGPDYGRWGHNLKLAELLKISHRVHFMGDMRRDAALSLAASSLFCVLPSRHEPFGMAALEAMALGKAVVATQTGPADFIDHGVSGFLVDPGDCSELERALMRLCLNARLRARMGTRARLAANAFSWDNAASRYISLFKATG